MATRILFATTNRGKINSLKREFDERSFTIEGIDIQMPEPRSSNVREITIAKLRYAYDKIRQSVVVSDAGFYIESLNGFPGAYVNFILDTIGIEGLLRLTHGRSRRCSFEECLGYICAPEKYVLFEGAVKGELAPEPRGHMQKHVWSEIGLIFIPDGSEKTLAEMTVDEYLYWRKIDRERSSPARQFALWFDENSINNILNLTP